MKEIDRRLRVIDQVIRHLVVRVDEELQRSLRDVADHAIDFFASDRAALENQISLLEFRLHDLTGLPIAELVAFRPERLALHELLVRVTADVSVPDGTKIEDLGINFREIVSVVAERYVAPRMDAISALSVFTTRSLLPARDDAGRRDRV